VLPDLPNLKQDLQQVLNRYLRKAIHQRLGVFSDIPRHTVHEGKSMRVYRADGSVEDTDMKEASAEMMLKVDELPKMSVGDRVAKINELADSMAKQMSEHLYGSLNQSLEKAGQVVDGRGKPFGVETMLAALEKIQIDFDKDGNPKNLSFVIGSDLVPRIEEMREQEKKDPTIKKSFDELMARKWQDWRDREAARKLVG